MATPGSSLSIAVLWPGQHYLSRASNPSLVTECPSADGGCTAAVPELPSIQALKPATKKKIISAIVATAKL
jgi:hypothetical protein